MNVTGTQTTQATTAPASEINTQSTQELQRRCWFPKPGYQPYPPFIQQPYFPGQQGVIGMVQQMLEMLMRMFQQMFGGGSRPQPAPMPRPLPPVRIGIPERPIEWAPLPGSGRVLLPIDLSKPETLIGRHIRDLPRSDMLAGNVRILTPDRLGTMEYNPNRLTIHVNDAGTITGAGWN
jgi:hypothetical protein